MTAILNTIEGTRARQQSGRIVEWVNTAIVQVDSPTYINGENLLLALRDAGLPADGSEMPEAPSYPEVRGLILMDRNAQMLAGSSTLAGVELIYRRPGLIDPEDDFMTLVSGDVTSEEVETQLDIDGVQITVEHGGVTQGGFVRVNTSRKRLTFEAFGQSSSPGNLADLWVNKANQYTWNSGSPGTWRWDSIAFEPINMSSNPLPTWKWTLTALFRDEGWDPSLVFIDPETGQPPPGLVADVGYKTIEHHTLADFDAVGL